MAYFSVTTWHIDHTSKRKTNEHFIESEDPYNAVAEAVKIIVGFIVMYRSSAGLDTLPSDVSNIGITSVKRVGK